MEGLQAYTTACTGHSVNHSIQFVERVMGVHTQNVESYRNRVKTKFKQMKGFQESMLPSYLDEFMWQEHHGRTAHVALQNLCRDIALRYSHMVS